MEGTNWLSQVGNLGFPIIVAMYVLIRLEGKMDELTDSIKNLTNTLTK